MASSSEIHRKQSFRRFQTLSPVDIAWAKRRGELVNQEYRGCQSGYAGPVTLQVRELYDRRRGRLRPETEAEAEERKAAADVIWASVKR